MRAIRTVVLAAAALAAACTPERGPTVPRGTPVVLISIDTLRSDRLPAYGYGGVETPAIDGLRRDGVLFERAYAHVPLTLPSHASIFTGQLPGVHGVRDNLGYPVSADAPLIQSTLHEAGYATGAAVSSYVLRGLTGVDRDFDVYDDDIAIPRMQPIAALQRSGAETARRALEWLTTVRDRPYFLFVHVYEPHTPYAPPEPFASRYAGAPYDGEVAAADAVVGTVLDALRARGDYDRALIVLLSDHGEGLGEHDEDEHGVFLYRTTLQVPLIVKLPGAERGGTTVREPAALMDIHPTVRAVLGMPPDARMQGRSLFELDADGAGRAIYSETFYPRLHFGWSELTSLIDGTHHYVHGPAPELFDLEQDPGETRNLAGPGSTVQADLAARVAEFATPVERPQEADPETLRNLASLGYVGSVRIDDGAALPDPRERREELRRIRAAFQLHSSGRHEQAVEALRRVLEENPNLVDGWESYARSLEALGRIEPAIAAYREAVSRSGGSPVLAIPAAALLQRAGHHDEARALAELGRTSDPVAADTVLAQVALREKNVDEAERRIRAALERRPRGIVQKLVLAEILVSRGRNDEAMREIHEAEQAFSTGSDPDPAAIRGLHLLRGRILASAGDGPAAEAEFLREIALFPDQTAAYSHLAILYAIAAGPREAEATLDRMVATNPDPAAYAAAIRTARVLRMEPVARRYLETARRRFPGDPRLEAALRP